MSVFLAIVFLCLSVGNSGEAIKPVVTFTPNWGNVLYHDSVTLTCNVPSTVPEEPRTYHWYRNQTLIEGDQQNLHIIRSSVDRDRGDYQCRTIGGDISDPVFLNVTQSYVILQRPPSTIYEGDPLTLRCHHIKDFNAKNTKFYKDDEEIQSSGTGSEFHIPNITMSQSGLYKCTKLIHRHHRPVIEKSDVSFISVKELFSPSEIKVTPPRVIEGGEMTVTCHTRLHLLRGGTELHFAFYRDGRTVRGYDGSDTYRVRSAQLEDSGKYTCEVRRRSGSVKKRSDGLYIQIHELPPPEIKVTPPRVIEGGEMTVTCDTRLDPLRGGTELHFAFYRDGRTVRGYNGSDTYRVRSAQLKDSGNYTCEVRTASNTVRKMSDELYIQIMEIHDFMVQNITRLVISVFVLSAAVCFIYFHNKW